MPHVSVVVPLYNTERYIGEAIASVLDQTYADFEIVVVDDGSRDHGPDIVRAIADPRIRLVTQENRGLAGARNTGIREARGEIIAFLDADDRWQPEKLEAHVELLEARPEVGLTFSVSRLIDEAGAPMGPVQRPSSRPLDAAHVFCRNPIGNGSAAVVRRATLGAVAYLDPKLGRLCWFDESFRQSEDVECWTRIAANTSWQLGFVDRVLTDYRVNSGGLSADTTRQLETWRRFRRKVAAYAPALDAAHGDTAEAYQLRYLARRAVLARDDTRAAFDLVTQAVRLSPRILIEEPVRTTTTLVAATVKRLVSADIFARIADGVFNRTRGVAGPMPQRSPGLGV